jgi:hypothetical protein
LATPEVGSVAVVGVGTEPIPAEMRPIPHSDGLQTWWVAFDDRIEDARVVAYDDASVPRGSWLVHDPGSTRTAFCDVIAVEDEYPWLPWIRCRLLEIYFNEEAQREAVKDGAISEGEELPNPVYVRDPGETRAMGVSRDALVTLIAYDADGNPRNEAVMTFEEFQAAFDDGLMPPDWYGGPFRVTSQDGIVIAMEQVYVV